MIESFRDYLSAIRETPLGQHTEYTGRSPLEALLRNFAAQGGYAVQHEPKREAGKGAPDFKLTKGGLILGYVETKPIGENLDKVLKSKQIEKYRELSSNLLLTDYLQFIWINGDSVQRARLCHATDLEKLDFRLTEADAAGVAKLLNGFFSTAPKKIGAAEDLALALATRSQLLRDFIGEEMVRQEREDAAGKLYGLFEVFRDQVFQELTAKEFADAFAQMLAYGLFLARLNSGKTNVTLHNAREHVPGSFRLIRELVDFLPVLTNPNYGDIRWVVEEILSIVNGTDIAAIHEDLSFRQRKVRRGVRARSEDEARLFERDPFVYFYEDYLSRYDPTLRESRGVYYTPPPVVNFIVRAIDDILKDKDTFNIKAGLADHNSVTVLDFACGTGTFLVEVFERIFSNIGGPDSGKAALVVREHMLRNIYGFEYLIAPYTIAHLKLSQYLKDKKHELSDDERLLIYLTNTLEPIDPQKNLLLPELTKEVEAAQRVKDKPILVITGNPPYSGHSRNMGPHAWASVQEYKKGFPDLDKPGQGKWLQDDYVKFIRFAQMKMDAVEEGIVGVITNHSYLDNPTFKGMRKSLMQTFDQIYILDLHGNAKKQERAPDGGDDQNVFDIQQGVAIAFFVKKPEVEKGVWHADLWGKRLSKYEACASGEFSRMDWQAVTPSAPLYLFHPWDEDIGRKYEKFWSVPAIFAPLGDPAPGIVTTHDQFAISFTREEAIEKVERLLATKTEAEARQLFRLCSQSQWSYEKAKKKLADGSWRTKVVPILYRPFDVRWTIWDSHVAVHRRERVMSHMLGPNFGLIFVRQISHAAQDISTYALVADSPVDNRTFLSSKGTAFLAPLYMNTDYKIYENISHDFRAFIDKRYEHHYTPEEIQGFIYAILHAATYREEYAEFLRMDFPRIPFPEDKADFEALSELGWDLIQKHLLRDIPDTGLGKYQGKGENHVERPRYAEAEQAIYINETQKFEPVPPEVWNFHIGGYQVMEKYLKDRKGRTLTLDEITNVENIANVLAFTIEQMEKIDAAYLAAFADRG
ncbi:type ISP restriction/modification enzyme [Dichotomicrobium thermohalophilum]|uniref:site-specific DNA-methyltransferase (adenine-specific) n=1 Tax=Dichotomicrobium thermohalophilum TaxID=933063 RepID=A0A397Q3A2_9HYPH|nr:type ISP restriction/modification enzyme [Dichotomicrobium thermohalophilum]RIA55403.1 N-6 DNA methylase [Dichotomicrobium thermohalophilum]